ncbi:RluA family pseudouridine synthase [Peribacillus sp. NPDC097295]|uniref:RluA family pseudouridine synthase n=1 Tax=Peribacillus sp. NPDC097295 TaxID=3364402 RepID=UPI003811901E
MKRFMVKGQTLSIYVPENWEHFTLEGLFRDHWKAPKKLVHEWRMSKEVKVNDVLTPWSSKISEGDRISIPLLSGENDPVIATDLGITIIYEDDLLLIANKPAGLDTHPSHPGDRNSLINGVAYHLQETGQTCIIKHIHRLDKDTTGAVLFAKDRLIGSMLDRMLEERDIKRTYFALVEGNLQKNAGKIDEKIGRDRHHATRRRVSPTGQTAITHYQVLERYPKENRTLVSCTLESGRTHQIRVHFSHLNHPLAGDTLYGGKKTFPRQALHARKMEFTHPISEEKIAIVAPFLDNPSIFETL